MNGIGHHWRSRSSPLVHAAALAQTPVSNSLAESKAAAVDEAVTAGLACCTASKAAITRTTPSRIHKERNRGKSGTKTITALNLFRRS